MAWPAIAEKVDPNSTPRRTSAARDHGLLPV
jgi:hypothetical protein